MGTFYGMLYFPAMSSDIFHTESIEHIAEKFSVNPVVGINSSEISERRTRYGGNIITTHRNFSSLRAVVRALFEPLALVLLCALVITAFIGAFVDFFVIALVVVINVSINVFQERRSSKIFKALSETTHHHTIVLRDGVEKNVQANEVVVGDIVRLVGGMRAPADGRLFEVKDLAVNESELTGEWKPQNKTTAVLGEDTNPQDRTNSIWAGSYVSSGYGQMIVTAVGAETRFGGIATHTLANMDDSTPLQKGLKKLSYGILLAVACIAAVIILAGVYRGEDIYTILLVALAVSIAAMPEGLPSVLNVILTSAMQSVHQQGGLIKRLYAAETLGSVTTILTDKTGTLTTGEMHFSGVVTAHGPENQDALSDLGREILATGVRASDAFIEVASDASLEVHGRPIEIAIVRAGLSVGLDQRQLKNDGHEQKQLVQFEPTRRFAITLNEHPVDGARVYLTGSPEQILDVCSFIEKSDGVQAISDEMRAFFAKEEKVVAAEGKRFTAVAYRQSSDRFISEDIQEPEHGERLGFVFLGMLLFSDTLREGIPELIATTKNAGISLRIATGDHPGTALYIAERIGLTGSQYTQVLLGADIERMDDNQLHAALKESSMYARVLPEHKLRIVHLLQESGEIVAMTGDGINDAPALTAANIGISLSSATDIAKEASDMVLLQDNFKVIVSAIREGRRALHNIRTVLVYLLSVSLGEVFLITGALLGGFIIPLTPVQILWANIVQEGFMSLPFALSPADAHSMKHRASRVQELLSSRLIRFVAVVSIGTGIMLFALHIFLSNNLTDPKEIRTIVFLSLSLSAVLSSFCFRDIRQPIMMNMRNIDTTFTVCFLISVGIFFLPFVVEPLQTILSLNGLHPVYIVIAVSFALLRVLFVEMSKMLCGTLMHRDTLRS